MHYCAVVFLAGRVFTPTGFCSRSIINYLIHNLSTLIELLMCSWSACSLVFFSSKTQQIEFFLIYFIAAQ